MSLEPEEFGDDDDKSGQRRGKKQISNDSVRSDTAERFGPGRQMKDQYQSDRDGLDRVSNHQTRETKQFFEIIQGIKRSIRADANETAGPSTSNWKSQKSSTAAPKLWNSQNGTCRPILDDEIIVLDDEDPYETECRCYHKKLDEDRYLHKMHSSKKKWLCNHCGFDSMSEMELFLHYVREHLSRDCDNLSDTARKSFKSFVIKTICPFSSCEEFHFTSMKEFKKHMSKEHNNVLVYPSSVCETRFVSKKLRDKHEQDHNDFFELVGTETECCPLCGELDLWNVPSDNYTGCSQSHLIRHGLLYQSACRCCLQKYPSDSNLHLIKKHMLENHCELHSDGYKCTICGHTGNNTHEEFKKHCAKKHVFHILQKSPRSKQGELVVSFGAEYENFVGLNMRTQGAAAHIPLRPTESSFFTITNRPQPVAPPQRGNSPLPETST